MGAPLRKSEAYPVGKVRTAFCYSVQVAPIRRSSGGAITAIIDWLHYADPALAPMRRSSIGSYTAIRDRGQGSERRLVQQFEPAAPIALKLLERA
jgi:hypothetical protein